MTTNRKTPYELSERDKRLLSAETFNDRRTIDRYIAGLPIRPSTKFRIEGALRKLGLPLAPGQQPKAA